MELIDQLASLARTALTDPNAIEIPVEYFRGGSGNGATRYAVDKLDEIINALNPAEFDRRSFADTLALLGRQIAERQAEIEFNAKQAEESGGENDAEALYDAVQNLETACDYLDDAIEALVPDYAAQT